MRNGTIIKGVGGLYSVYADGKIFSCKPRGIFRKTQQKPMIGDNVILAECDAEDLTAVVEEILPRKNSLIRPAVANVDRIVFVLAAVAPQPDLLLLDKMLAAARYKDIECVIVVNKSDQNSKTAEMIAKAYASAANRVIIACAAEGKGICEIRDIVSEGISVLAGQSGVGKSSVINCLLENDTMETGGLTKKLERGKHTTRHSEMFEISGGLVIDSPGFSLFELTDIGPAVLQECYPEMVGIVGKCRFMDCSHTGEPGCLVSELVKNEELDEGRYFRYKEIYLQLKAQEKNKYK